MKNWKRTLKKLFVLGLSVILLGSSTDLSALSVLAAENSGKVYTKENSYVEETEIVTVETMTSAPAIGLFGLDEGTVDLISGTAADWIDRIDITEELRDFYDKLVESSDNDGIDDFMIEDRYFDGDNVIAAMTIKETISTGEDPQTWISETSDKCMPFVVAVCNAFDRDHPEVFWNSRMVSCKSGASYYTDGENYEMTLTVELVLQDTSAQNEEERIDMRIPAYADEEAIKTGIAKRDERVSELCDAVAGKTVYEKLEYFNDVLTGTNQYNTGSDLDAIDDTCREGISALLGAVGDAGPVCEGYARAFKILCDAEEIPCVLVDGADHMWNYVRVDGSWYAVDVTWNDPVPSGGYPDATAVSGYENLNFFLVGSETVNNGDAFITTHPVENAPSLNGVKFTNGPELSTSKYEYSQYTDLSDAEISLDVPAGGFAYDKTEKKPGVVVTLDGKALVENTDYRVAYENNVNAGMDTAIVKISGLGQYVGQVIKSFTIYASDAILVTVGTDQIVFADEGIFVQPEFTGVDSEVVKGTLTYSYAGTDNMNYDAVVEKLALLTPDETVSVGYSFVVTDSNYTGTKNGTINLRVEGLEFYVGTEAATEENAVEKSAVPVFGMTWDDVIKIKSGIKAQIGEYADTEASHFDLDVTGTPSAGEHEFRVLYNGTLGGKQYTDIVVCTGTVVIGRKDITGVIVTLNLPDVGYTYDKTAKEPGALVVLDGVTLVAGTDYALSYKENVNAGIDTAVVTITAMGNYTGTADETFSILPSGIVNENVTTVQNVAAGNASFEEPKFTGIDGENVEGSITYSYDGNAGLTYAGVQELLNELDGDETAVVEYSFVPAAEGNYTGTKTGTISLSTKANKMLNAVLILDIPASGYVYDKTAKTPEVTVKVDDKTLVKDTDYTVSYQENINAGDNAVAIVSGRGKYSGTVFANFSIMKKEVEAEVAVADKVYDGTEVAAVSVTVDEADLCAGDILLISDSVGNYVSADVADAIPVNVVLGTVSGTGCENYSVTLPSDITGVIKTADYAVTVKNEQTILKGNGELEEPGFTGVGDEAVSGTLTYSYGEQNNLSLAALLEKLNALQAEERATVDYRFVPTAGGNYAGEKTGTITVAVRDLEFYIGSEKVTAENGVTIAANPSYGDTWEEILKINAGLVAVRGDLSDETPAHFTLNVTGTPDAGLQTYAVLYSGTIDGTRYTDVEVCSGTVTVAKKTLTVEAGDYKVSKVYDKTTAAGTAGGALKVVGLLESDTAVTVDTRISDYTASNVGGQDKVRVTLSLSGEDSRNYVLEKEVLDVPCEILPMTVTPVINVSGTYIYTGTAKEPAFTVETAEGEELTKADYTFSYQDNVNAGNGKVLLRPVKNSNYTWDGEAAQTFVIEKAIYEGKTGFSANGIYGTGGVINLITLLPEGAGTGLVLGDLATEDTYGVLSGAVIKDGTTLKYNLAANPEALGKGATITVEVADSTNYEPYQVVLEIMSTVKAQQISFQFNSATVDKTYGDLPFMNAAYGQVYGSGVTYASSDPTVATVDNTGKVTILKVGSTVISAYASETSTHQSAYALYTLRVAKKQLKWDTTGLSAKDTEGEINNRRATLSGALKVSGIVAADQEHVTYSCPASKLVGVYASTEAGTQKITLGWKNAASPSVLEGSWAINYELPTALPTIYGKIRVAEAEEPENEEQNDPPVESETESGDRTEETENETEPEEDAEQVTTPETDSGNDVPGSGAEDTMGDGQQSDGMGNVILVIALVLVLVFGAGSMAVALLTKRRR